MVAASAMIALVAAVMIAWWLVRLIWTSPHSMTRYFRARKRDRGYQALSTGLIAVGAGNAPAGPQDARRARVASSAPIQEPLIHLLEAQAALIEGKHDEARKKFEQMAEDPETRELGLRGLYLEARRLGANEAARQYAEKRRRQRPPICPGPHEATLEYRSQAGRWDDAIRLLDQQKAARVVDKKEADRLQAVLLTARAGEKLEGEPGRRPRRCPAGAEARRRFRAGSAHGRKGLFREGQACARRPRSSNRLEISDRIRRSRAAYVAPAAAIPRSTG